MSRSQPFTVSDDWIYYAHNPGAESKQPAAVELMRLPSKAGRTIIPADRADLVREVVSVAELYTPSHGMDAEDMKIARRAAGVVRRGRAWLKDNDRAD